MTTASRISRALPGAFFAALALWTAWLFARFVPPFADLPQHAWTLAMLRHPDVYADAFVTTLEPWHTNSLWFTLDRALAVFFTPEESLALACGLAVVSLPLAVGAWARALGRDGALAMLLGWWIAWTRPLYWGFVHYSLSLPLAVATLALDQRRGRGQRVGVAVLLVFVYLLHAQTWAFLLLALALQRVARETGARHPGEALLLSLPSVLLFGAFALENLVHPEPGAAPLASLLGGLKPELPDPGTVLDFVLINASAAIKWTQTDDRLARALVLAAGLGLARAARADPTRRALGGVLAIGLAGLGIYLFAPINVLGQFQISTRMAPWVLIAAIPAASPVLQGWAHRVAWGLAAAGAVATLAVQTITFPRYEAEARPAFSVLNPIPPGARVALWTDWTTSRVAYGAVYVHFLAWYAERGLGRTQFSFAEFRPNPVVYRDPLHYPRAVAGEETRPWCPILAGDGVGLDYIATRGDANPDAKCRAIAVYPEALHEEARVKDWALYKVTGPLPRRSAPGCACGSRAPRVGAPILP